ncbi:MAG: permease prefix domain 1-containing protein, partial [Gemmatimonadaceae bacterium]
MKRIFHLGNSADSASRDVNREIELHLDLRAKEFEALGMNADDARKAALDAFGDRNAIEHEVSDLRVSTVRERQRRDWFAELKQDVMIGLRSFRRAPVFTIIALLTLGVGIGANTAIFSVVRSVLLRPLPYTNSEQLVQLWTDHRALGRAEPEWLNPPDFF